MKPERHSVTLGFLPLTDCAPMVVARELGYFAAEGLNVALSRESSWATLRDKVMVGVLDAAHMLAPMPIASTLGLGGFARPMVTALSLGLNGNGITVSNTLHARMCEADLKAMRERPVSARALRKVIDIDRREQRPPMRFAVVFPFSMHNYELRYWMAAGGVDPDNDVRLIVVPPPQMVASLSTGKIDGYCVGEPWNLLAAAEGVGRTLITGSEIWSSKPEKVLAVSRDWADHNPLTHKAIMRALIRAGRWLDDPVNRDHAAAMLSEPRYVGVDATLLAQSLPVVDRIDSGTRGIRARSNPKSFFASLAMFPWRSHAMWIITQMYRWGQLVRPVDIAAAARSVYLCELYRDVAAQMGIDVPAVDAKVEGVHAQPWHLENFSRPIAMGADAFMDGRTFDPERVVEYLASFDIQTLTPAIQALSLVNV